MQKWEYLMVLRWRHWEYKKNADGIVYKPTNWQTQINEKYEVIDFGKYLNDLGYQGWELVSTLAESSVLGGENLLYGKLRYARGFSGDDIISGKLTDYAGFTDTEKWVFKRPIP